MALTTGLESIRATARASFWTSFENYPSIMDGIIFRTTSDSDQETYPWLAYAPGVREMTGSRLKRSVPELSWAIKNKKFENTVILQYELLRFNKVGTVAALMANLGAKARAYPDKLASALINAGNGALCYDGQYFFDTDHSDPGAAYTTSQSNSLTSDATNHLTPTDLEMAAAIRGGYSAMLGFVDGDGDPVMMDANSTITVMVPPSYAAMAQRVSVVDQLTGPVGNDLKGRFRVVVNPWLPAPSTTAAFYMFNDSGARKALIYQVADDIRLEDDMGQQNEFDTKDASFGTFGFYNVGYGDWRYAVRHIFT